jgi:hypothetical protein
MKDIRAIVVCVDYYDILALTLPYNRDQFDSVLVVTHPEDSKTIAVASEHGADLFLTEIFYERNAVFNKFAAIEQGLDYMGKYGWLCILDADIAVQSKRHSWNKKNGKLYVPRRLVHEAIPSAIPSERKWRQNLVGRHGFGAYCQIFHADDPALPKGEPWHMTDSTWTGMGEMHFENHWNPQNKVRPPFEVLHIGQNSVNWAGRVTPFADGTVHEKSDYRRSVFQTMMNQRRVHLMYDNERIK